MREQSLKEYFENTISAEQLSIGLINSVKQTSFDVKTYYIENLQEGEFEITTEHLLKLCNDTITKKLTHTNLNVIAYTLMASDFFFWNEETSAGAIINNVLFELDNPGISNEINTKNVQLWRHYLITGEYLLNKKS